jgi:Tfp pilus assembly protein PilF
MPAQPVRAALRLAIAQAHFIREELMQELARYYLSQGKTVRAAALMIKLVKTEPTPENLSLLADIYMQQGLFDDAKELYLRVVKAELK